MSDKSHTTIQTLHPLRTDKQEQTYLWGWFSRLFFFLCSHRPFFFLLVSFASSCSFLHRVFFDLLAHYILLPGNFSCVRPLHRGPQYCQHAFLTSSTAIPIHQFPDPLPTAQHQPPVPSPNCYGAFQFQHSLALQIEDPGPKYSCWWWRASRKEDAFPLQICESRLLEGETRFQTGYLLHWWFLNGSLVMISEREPKNAECRREQGEYTLGRSLCAMLKNLKICC